MTTIELTDEELRLVREALKAFLNDFGHEEMDVVRQLKALLAKLPGAEPPKSDTSGGADMDDGPSSMSAPPE
jgi:hypothetical protein